MKKIQLGSGPGMETGKPPACSALEGSNGERCRQRTSGGSASECYLCTYKSVTMSLSGFGCVTMGTSPNFPESHFLHCYLSSKGSAGSHSRLPLRKHFLLCDVRNDRGGQSLNGNRFHSPVGLVAFEDRCEAGTVLSEQGQKRLSPRLLPCNIL